MSYKPAFSQYRIGLQITPLDPLFFRDGRPFDSGSTRGTSGLPTPRTLAGMMRWHLMEQEGKSRRDIKAKSDWLSRLSVHGPWLAEFKGTTSSEELKTHNVCVPVPSHLVQLGKGEDTPKHLLRPLEKSLPGWNVQSAYESQSPMRPLWGGWQDESFKPLEGKLLSLSGLQKVLNGKVPDDKELKCHKDFYEMEERTGLAINPETVTGEDGLLYSIRLMRLREHVGFYAEVGVEDNDQESFRKLESAFPTGAIFLAPFGGEGRRVQVKVLKEPITWPSSVPQQSGERFCTILISPACFTPRNPLNASGRQFPPIALGTLVSAAIGKPIVESGWSLGSNKSTKDEVLSGVEGRSRGLPRATRHLVPAGSVYFWQKGTRAQNPAPPDAQYQFAQSPIDRINGYGLALTGSWDWYK
ncbi:MAG: type III-B CRISPR module-associated protein Cmr3 [Candidatus Sumerlaeia bacterium]|nr:type III-B CRISPR module-associated protein Cmr3 [Candidatus Sumerlaeia bacterium]